MLPNQRLVYEARARIGEDERYAVAVGEPLESWPPLYEHTVVYARYFLAPRTADPDAAWLLCLNCDSQRRSGRVAGRGRGRIARQARMTIRAIAGLLALNALYLAVGTSVLAALRGWRSAREWGSFAGLAYLLGVSTLGVLWVLLLVIGIPFRGATILVSAALVVVVAAAVARARRRPVGWGRSPARVLTRLSLVTAVGIAAVAVFFEALFRAGRLHGLYAFDGWAFWIPKATSIFGSGQLEPDVLEQLANPSYPPLVPTLDAAAFHAMGGADVVTLHLQYWLFAVGFCTAAAGLLSRRVPTWILWPFLVLALVAPRMSGSLLVPQADFLLQFLLCTAALLGAAWLVGSASWQLPAVTILLGACVLTKREGIFLAAVLAGRARGRLGGPMANGVAAARPRRARGRRDRVAVAPLVPEPGDRWRAAEGLGTWAVRMTRSASRSRCSSTVVSGPS